MRYRPEAWCFPIPVRRSRFEAMSLKWAAWNVETDPGAVGTWSLTRSERADTAWFDYQTQPDSNAPGRLGSGRAAVYRGFHVKGIGRTLAAANWNDRADFYHNTGHMSPDSAFREFAITRILRARGLGEAIVPCETILLGALTGEEQRQLAGSREKVQRHLTRAAGCMLAASLKRAGFARASNLIWALDHLHAETSWIGRIFVDFERLLRHPQPRTGVEGSPESIAAAMSAAFERSYENMLAFAANGLSWIYLQNNCTLDGRWVDLETPLFTGNPMVGKIILNGPEGPVPQMAGFDCYAAASSWRLFLRWFDAKLAYLSAPRMLDHPAGTAFLRAVRKAIRAHFREHSLLFRDSELQSRAVAYLSDRIGIQGHADRQRLARLSRYCFRVSIHGANEAPPEIGWVREREQPAPPSPGGAIFESAPFATCALSPDAAAFRADLEALGKTETPSQAFALLRPTPAQRARKR